MAKRRKTRKITRKVAKGQEKKDKRRSKKVEKIDLIVVTPKSHRVIHWGTAIAFFFTALTGLFHYYRVPFVPQPLGGVWLLGWLHFGAGVAFFAGIVLFFFIYGFRSLAFGSTEIAWWKNFGGFLKKHARPMPAARLTGGQKAFTIMICLACLILFATGAVMRFWDVLIRDKEGLVNTLCMLHVFMVTIVLTLVVAHIYFSSIATPGRIGAMWGGRVTKDFMAVHHSEMDLEKIRSREEEERKRREEELERKKSRMKSARTSGKTPIGSKREKSIGSKRGKIKGKKSRFIKKKKKKEEELPPEEVAAEEAEAIETEDVPAEEVAGEASVADAGVEFDESEFEDGEFDEKVEEDDEDGDAIAEPVGDVDFAEDDVAEESVEVEEGEEVEVAVENEEVEPEEIEDIDDDEIEEISPEIEVEEESRE